MARLKTGPKVILVVLAAGAVVLGLRQAAERGLVPTPGIVKAVVPQRAVLPELKDARVQHVAPAPLPGADAAAVPAPLIRGMIWEWNAQMGLIYANGGARTSQGSLMERRGVNLLLERQDDTGKMQEALLSCARELHGGASQCAGGANFVVIMGDGAGQFAAAVNPQLRKLGQAYGLRVIGAVGYSRGEDCFMAAPEVKADPQKARGRLVAGVLRDGDWNIAMKWAADNDVPNNPDERTYDPGALNWVNSPDYNAAAADYVAGKCEERKVVKDGRLTGEVRKVCVDAVVTWTPGDVTVAKQKGGLVKVVSSKQYRSQMPAVIVGPRQFFEQHREEVQNMLAASFEGADQVRAFDVALRRAAELSAQVYADQDGAYWYRYYRGVAEKDATGLVLELGGSTVANLADNLILFGLQPGVNDNFRSTYMTFAGIVVQQYPALFRDTPIPDVKDVEDRSFLTGAQAVMADPGGVADVATYGAGGGKAEVVSRRSYRIQFETGKATVTPEGERQLAALKDSLAITGLFIQVDGYTDDTGSDAVNRPLSQARAAAIQDYLQRLAPESFPSGRFAVAGHGSLNPLATNATAAGRAANRRVEIALLER